MKINDSLVDVDELKNNEEVRIYRLHMLEENQVKILNKIDELERKLDENYTDKIKSHDTRLELLEKSFSDIERFKWLVIVETIGILGLIVKSMLGL